jgi:hypothetical protein
VAGLLLYRVGKVVGELIAELARLNLAHLHLHLQDVNQLTKYFALIKNIKNYHVIEGAE